MRVLRAVSKAIEDYVLGPPAQRKTRAADRRVRLGHVLPLGNRPAARITREILMSIDDLKYGLPQIRSRPIRLALGILFAPALLMNDAVIFALRIASMKKRAIVSAPASKVLALIKFLVPKKAFDRIFAQAVEDFREEYYLELAEGRVWRARWLHVGLYLTLLSTTALWLGTSAAKKAVNLWKIT